jgi:hypothetical protein
MMGTRAAALGCGVLIVLFGGAVVFEHVRLAQLVATAVNEDVALMWLTARDWGAGQLHQPSIYGQAYGWSPEALPIEALRRLGAPLWVATSSVFAGIAVVGWFSLAAAAWRRAQPVVALLAVLAPALLAAYYAFYVSAVPTYQGPHLVAIAGAALLIARPRRRVLEGAAWTLLGLGLLMDPSAALIGAPVAAAHLLRTGIDRRRLVVLAAGSVLPVAYLAWSQWFHRVNPDHVVFGGASVRPDWSTLVDSVGDPDPYFELVTLQLVPAWPVLLVLVGALVGVLLIGRRWRSAVPALLVPLLLAWGLATPKATGAFMEFVPPGRIFATLPHGVWFLAFLVADSGALRGLRLPSVVRLGGVVALVGLAAASVVVRQVGFTDEVVPFLDRAVEVGTQGAGYGFVDTGAHVRRCDELERAARTIDEPLLIFVADRLSAYGCRALAYGRVETLVAERERRTWRLYDELDRSRSSAVLGDAPADFCDFAAPRVTSCRPVEGGGVALTFPPQSVLALMERLSLRVRDFGPDCEPELSLTVTCAEPLRPSLPQLRYGPPPDDERGAERAVASAFERSLDIAGGFTSVEAGDLVADAVDPRRYEEDFGDAGVAVRRIDLLSETQARAELDVVSPDGRRRPLDGWAVHREGSWLVDRNTFCTMLYLAATDADRADPRPQPRQERAQQWCAPVQR